MILAFYDNPEMIRFLIQNGAHFNGECSKGFDAMYYAKSTNLVTRSRTYSFKSIKLLF